MNTLLFILKVLGILITGKVTISGVLKMSLFKKWKLSLQSLPEALRYNVAINKAWKGRGESLESQDRLVSFLHEPRAGFSIYCKDTVLTATNRRNFNIITVWLHRRQ
jgi:hypothetical protein